jgi:hypothetical protein
MIQYAVPLLFWTAASECWMPAGACDPAGQWPDRVAGMTSVILI